jgi:hypothetical protein
MKFAAALSNTADAVTALIFKTDGVFGVILRDDDANRIVGTMKATFPTLRAAKVVAAAMVAGTVPAGTTVDFLPTYR